MTDERDANRCAALDADLSAGPWRNLSWQSEAAVDGLLGEEFRTNAIRAQWRADLVTFATAVWRGWSTSAGIFMAIAIALKLIGVW